MPKRTVIKYKGKVIIRKPQYKKIIRKYIRIIKSNRKRKKFQIVYSKTKAPIQAKLYRKKDTIPIFYFGKHNVINHKFTLVNKIGTPYSFFLLIFVEYKYKMHSNSQGVQYNDIFRKKNQPSFKETFIVNILIFTPNKYIWNIYRMNENLSMNENGISLKRNTDENALKKKSIREKTKSVNVFNTVYGSKNANFSEDISINKNTNISKTLNISVNTNINKNTYINTSTHVIAYININTNPYININGSIYISANISKNTYISSGIYLIYNTYLFQNSHLNKQKYASFNKSKSIYACLRTNYIKEILYFIENAYIIACFYSICILCTCGNTHVAENAYISSIYLINIACRSNKEANGTENLLDNYVCTKFYAHINIWIYMLFYGMHNPIKKRKINENSTKLKCNNSENTLNKCKNFCDIYTYNISIYYVEIPCKKTLGNTSIYEGIHIKNNKGRHKDIKKLKDTAKTTKFHTKKINKFYKFLLKVAKIANNLFKKIKNTVKLLYAHIIIILKKQIQNNKIYINFNYFNKNLLKINKLFKIEDKLIIKYKYFYTYLKIFIFILKLILNNTNLHKNTQKTLPYYLQDQRRI
ncbi:cyclin-related protein, putative [Plasmodium vinckei petteri]|uniref:Cyclin-related protein, putative n=1 Tax=Plasmodium vinckei petteri TaxID=138298 RepID=A0A6V7TGX0_PLAVN|nr:cyclin-related protein, putative [Plasmodium vinckei petteri]